jgi:hypothetical protein
MKPIHLAVLAMVLFWNATAQNIGIGTNVPLAPLSFNDAPGNKILFAGNGQLPHIGIGTYGKLQFYVSDINSNFLFGKGNAANFTEVMRIRGDGSVGIGTGPMTFPLEVKGDVSFTGPELAPGCCNNITGLGNGIYFNDNTNTGPLAFLGAVKKSGPVTTDGFGIASTNQINYMRFAIDKELGGLILNNSYGLDGQVVKSGGPISPAFWDWNPIRKLYDYSGVSFPPFLSQLTDNSPVREISGMQYSTTLAQFSKLLMQVSINFYTDFCDFCPATVFELAVVKNGTVHRKFRYSIPNGTSRTISLATILDMLPGTPLIKVVASKISGPSLTISEFGAFAVKLIPEH